MTDKMKLRLARACTKSNTYAMIINLYKEVQNGETPYPPSMRAFILQSLERGHVNITKLDEHIYDVFVTLDLSLGNIVDLAMGHKEVEEVLTKLLGEALSENLGTTRPGHIGILDPRD